MHTSAIGLFFGYSTATTGFAADEIFGLRFPGLVAGPAMLVVAALLGAAARQVVGRMSPRWGPALGRAVAVVIWGAGGVAGLARLGVPTALTVPIVLVVAAALVVVLTLGALGMHPARTQPRCRPRFLSGPRGDSQAHG